MNIQDVSKNISCNLIGGYSPHRRGVTPPLQAIGYVRRTQRPDVSIVQKVSGTYPNVPVPLPFFVGDLGTRLIRGFLSQRDSSPPKRHLDRLSVFAWLTGVPNTQARRPRYAAQTSVPIGRICAEYDMKSWRNKFICNSKKSVDNEATTRLRRPRVGHGSGRVGSGD